MIIIVLGIAIALFCYRMGILIGRAEAEEEFNKIRKSMGLDEKDEALNKLYYGDD